LTVTTEFVNGTISCTVPALNLASAVSVKKSRLQYCLTPFPECCKHPWVV
jgi:hypothetical protein